MLMLAFKRVWKKVESQGKVSEKSGNLYMDIEWQPWLLLPIHHGPVILLYILKR